MRESILRRYKGKLNFEDFVLAIDDTDNPKYSKYLFGVQSWRCSKESYYGQKILVIALVDVKKNFAIPLDFRVCWPKKIKAKMIKNRGLILLLNYLSMLLKIFGFLPVVAGSWFDSSDLAVKLRNSGITYVWEIKSYRKAKKSPGRHKSWKCLSYLYSGMERHQVNSEKNKWISERLIVLKSKSIQIKTVAASNRKNGKDAFASYASTDRCMPGAKVWKIFRDRRNIECLFHDFKSHLNFGCLSVSDDKANELAFVIPFVIITYCQLNPGALGLKQNMTVKRLIKTLKMEQEYLTLDLVRNGEFHKLLEEIKLRKNNINKNPVISGTEENRAVCPILFRSVIIFLTILIGNTW